MTTNTCGNCRFFKPDEMQIKDTECYGFCEFKMPDFIPRFDDDEINRRMRSTDSCSLLKKKKA